MSRAGSRKGIPNKTSILARDELLRKGINPIDLMYEVYKEAMKSYENSYVSEKGGDPGTGYLSTAGQMAKGLMEYYAPKLSAVAVEVHDKTDNPRELKAINAMEIIRSDPFAQHALRIAEKVSLEEQPLATPPILPKGTEK